MEPVFSSTFIAFTSGRLHAVAVKLHKTTGTIDRVWWETANTGTGLTAGLNYFAIYDHNGALLSQTADLTTAWSTQNALRSATFPAIDVAALPGTYIYVALLATGTTPPQFTCADTRANISDFASAGIMPIGRSAYCQVHASPVAPPQLVRGGSTTVIRWNAVDPA